MSHGDKTDNYKNKTMPISNSIFEHYRTQERVKEVKNSVKILIKLGWTLFDPEGNMLNKHNTKFDTEGDRILDTKKTTSYK